ncbi:MAG: pseudouridine-5'-phosphate glycosidase [Acidobacteria bacterium]|nr:pseudouridine-5'-phosphate glycosidase [Acidobacteriota bacterium]MCK6681580.1 pseudouridine-5'-phosphate glycosidase [Thermoanaerobaculia bacterium]
MTDCNPFLHLAEPVADALASGQPVVALESTVISHGMPYPKNLETAHALEDLVREHGAVPATIAVIDGQIRVGLSSDDLARIAEGRESVRKLSRRDLPIALAQGGLGATTVAATMIAAALAGIRVFATGGIGGVHREAQMTFDISADITELARTPVAVVCAGAKSILDVGLTLEVLETHGVPVLGFRTDSFPAFYCRSSAFPVDARVESADELARICRAKWSLGLEGGVVVANPVPEAFAMEESAVSAVISKALAEARERGVSGKELTPFLLGRLNELTDGRSLQTNIALIRNNASLAALLAVALARGSR